MSSTYMYMYMYMFHNYRIIVTLKIWHLFPHISLAHTPWFFSKGSPLCLTCSYTSKGSPLCPTCLYIKVHKQRVPPYVPRTCSYTKVYEQRVPPYVPLAHTPRFMSKGSPLCPTYLLVHQGLWAKDPPLMPHLLIHQGLRAKGPPLHVCLTCLYTMFF